MPVQPNRGKVDQAGYCASMPAANVEGLMAPDVVQKIQEKFKEVFEPVDACPPARAGVDHVIRLQPGSSPTYMRPF